MTDPEPGTQDERERLIEQATDVLLQVWQARAETGTTGSPREHCRALATALVKAADWRPPPSGDVIEWLADLIHMNSCADDNCYDEEHALRVAQRAADRGLLRTPGESVSQQKAPKFRIVGTWLAQEVDGCTCGGGGPDGHPPHESGCGLEPEVDLATVPGWESVSIPVPPPDELVERAEKARVMEYQAAIRRAPSNRKGQGVSGADVIKANHEAMRAALRAAGEGQHG